MIEGLGIDNVEVNRMEKILERGNAFRDRVFTSVEIEYCSKQTNYAQSFAARFAAKEAFVKALGTGFTGNLDLNQIEVRSDTLGKPYLSLSGEAKSIIENRKIEAVHVSLTHTAAIASAIVILEK
jgi:holo-[acyl-carrier protein] synthase